MGFRTVAGFDKLSNVTELADAPTNNDLDGRVGIDYGVTGTPETFVIDKAGIIRMKHIGPINGDNWQSKFEPLLKELNQ